jgi:hypothetical protein
VTIDPALTQQQELLASDAEAFDLFGASVGISGETVVVGAFRHDDEARLSFEQGAAYVFAPPANQPPNCSGAFPSVLTIWPPNHDMVNIAIQGVTDPDGDPVTINIDQIKQDEPTDGTGDGHTCPDGAGIGTSTAQVRAERSAQGDGRVYTIYFTASDGKGGSCQGSVTVCVPHANGGSCTNGGAIFDSTQCDTSLDWQSGLDRISDLVRPPRDGGEYNVIPLGRVADHLGLHGLSFGRFSQATASGFPQPVVEREGLPGSQIRSCLWPSRPKGGGWRPGAVIVQSSCGTPLRSKRYWREASRKTAKRVSEGGVSMAMTLIQTSTEWLGAG